MARLLIALLVVGSVLHVETEAFAQFGTRDRGEPIFTPLKNLRKRAENGVISDAKAKACENCKLNGKLFPKAACKRCERAKQEEKEEKEEKEKDEKTEQAELKKLEAEAEIAELEAKKLKEEDEERNKPWDIADEENKELGSDLLKLAAESKQHQDLAPKKQQALNYLASLGCNKDPNVSMAILAGLKDHNVEVRQAAVETVLTAVRGPVYNMTDAQYGSQPVSFHPYSPPPVYAAPARSAGCGSGNCGMSPAGANPDCPACEIVKRREAAKMARKAQRGSRFSSSCGNCRGQGCYACDNGYAVSTYGQPYEPYVEQECQSCSSSDGFANGCKSCCTEEVLEELKKMAFDPDPDRSGCFYEPSIEVRNLALEAVTLCPAIPEPESDPDETDDSPDPERPGTDESDDGPDSERESSDDDDQLDSELLDDEDSEESLDSPEPDDEFLDGDDMLDDELQDESDALDDELKDEREDEVRFRRPGFRSASHSRRAPERDPRFIQGKISKFYRQGYLIQHSSQYMIPEGHHLYITGSDADEGQVVEVVASQAGAVQVSPIQGRLGRSASIQIGIMR